MRAGALGDLLLLRPVFASLRRAGFAVTLLAPRSPAAAVARDVDELWAWDGPDVAALLAGGACARRFELAVCYSRDEDLAGAAARMAAQVVVQPPLPSEGHAADWALAALARAGVPASRECPPPQATADEEAAAAAINAALPPGFLALHPGSGSGRKNWPTERFLELARRLSPERPFLVAAGPAEAEVVPLFAGSGAVVAADLPLGVLGSVLSHAGLYVGNDSGATHLAAAWGAPTLALFGPSDPAAWAPLGPMVRTLRAPGQVLQELAVDAVEAAGRGLRSWAAALPCG